MAEIVPEELNLIIKTQDAQATEALKEFEGAVNQATEAIKESGEAARTAGDQTEKAAAANKGATATEVEKTVAVDKSVTAYAKLVGAYAAVGLVMRKGMQIYKELAAEGEKNILAEAKLAAVLRATGKEAEYSVSQVGRWAENLRKTTGLAEADIVDMTGSLSTFKNLNADIMPKVLEHSANLSSLWGEGLTGSAKKLGRALEDPLKGMSQLEESGVVLDSQSKKLITTLMEQGKVSEAQEILLNALDTRVGGLAASMQNALGPVGDFRATLGELKGAIGEDLLSIPGLQYAVQALDEYLDKRKDRRNLSSLFMADRDGSLQQLLSGMDMQELEYQISLVGVAEATDVAQTFRRDFAATRETLLTMLQDQMVVRAEMDKANQKQVEINKRESAREEAALASLQEQETATKALAELYAATEQGKIEDLQKQLELIKQQRNEDKALLDQEALINDYGNEENKARLEAARTRVEYYDAVIAGKQAELDGLQKVEVEQGYLEKLLGAKSAQDYVLSIPLSFDFDRSYKGEMEEQLSALKSQINKLWTAGPAEGDAGEWQTSLDVLVGKYDEIERAIKSITEAEQMQAQAKELLQGLLTEEQLALRKKITYQQELEKLEAEGLITAEERQQLWDKEYGSIDKVRSVSVVTQGEFKAMGESLSKQLLNAEAIGSTLSNMMQGFGSALASGESGLASLSQSSGQFVQSVMSQISQMALASGLRVIAETGVAGLPVALGLFALGGIAGVSAGLLGGSGAGLDETMTKAMQEEVKAREKLAESINKTIDTEYDLLKRQLDRNLIGIDEFRSQAGDLQGQRSFANAKAALSSAASTKMGDIDSELSDMSGWSKFWTGKDEDLEKRAKSIQGLFDAIESVSSADQLRAIQSQLETLGVSTAEIPAYAKGGEFVTSGPQLIKVGDNPGGVEHVRITPISSSSAANQMGMVVNINGPVFDYEDLHRKLSQAGVKVARKGTR